MVFGYGSFGVVPARPVVLDRASLLKMDVASLADVVARLDTSLKTAQADLSTRTQERDAALRQRDTFAQQASLVPGLKQQADLVPALQQQNTQLRNQVSIIPGLQQQANLVPALQQQRDAFAQQASLVPGLQEQAKLVPVLEGRVRDLNAQASLVPGLREDVKIVSAQRDTFAANLNQTQTTLKATSDSLAAESTKARNFEALANARMVDLDAVKANASGLTQMLAQVQANFEAAQADNRRLASDLQSERSARTSFEASASRLDGELSNAKTALLAALSDKDSSLAEASRQWKGQLDAALEGAKVSLEAERQAAREERGRVEGEKKDLGQKYEELLVKYREALAELEKERAKYCPVCQDCPAQEPCPVCEKVPVGTSKAAIESSGSPWLAVLALGGGYLLGKNMKG